MKHVFCKKNENKVCIPVEPLDALFFGLNLPFHGGRRP